ncbi:helix-turn-helix domain-containing protein [Nonomuraea sp. NPDC005650]|uniref:TetR/AcrR family transcriptional regulator n=1 Tax=Nonomuraea sp. NPDC005650 TaxID=3157045 RepID=UPI0033AAE435
MTTDRRVRRTRSLLRQAAIEVIREKGFRAAQVRDITERADVNRATFYAHYADKYALADELVRDEIRRRFATRLPAAPAPVANLVHALAVLLWEDSSPVNGCRRDINVLRPLIQRAVRTEVCCTLVERCAYESAVTAHIAGSTIVGAVCWWRENGLPDTPPDQVADEVTRAVLHGLRPASR